MSHLPQYTLETRLKNAIFHDFANLDLLTGRVTYSSEGIERMIKRIQQVVQEEIDQQTGREIKHADIDIG